MRKLLLLLITLTTLSNVSYASFPVAENTQTEIIENTTLINSPESTAYMILGFFVGFFSFVLFFLPLFLLYVPNKSFRKGIIVGLIIISIPILLGILFYISGAEIVIM
tara:strand:- start:65 stop:388 length:324 start_codon:yes stop_codon:yes gene_type:complete